MWLLRYRDHGSQPSKVGWCSLFVLAGAFQRMEYRSTGCPTKRLPLHGRLKGYLDSRKKESRTSRKVVGETVFVGTILTAALIVTAVKCSLFQATNERHLLIAEDGRARARGVRQEGVIKWSKICFAAVSR